MKIKEFVVKKQLLAVILGALGATAAAWAQAAAPAGSAAVSGGVPTKIGIIEIQNALVSTKDGQKAMVEFQTKLEPRKKELEKKAADIRELQDKLQRGGAAMAETAKQDLTRQIDQKTKLYNRDMQDAQDEADQEQRKIIDELSGKLTPVIDRYAQANGFAVILDVSSPQTPVMYASASVNITKDIIDMYDKTMPGTAGPKPATTSAPKPAAPPAPKPATLTPPAVKKQP
ncbi:MAG TPA: OmpH family outer membrane protein [Bryobacteraceae bacterium]|nr:OmpH family outer membrane protein [Bryobacteraceae bacterium]